MMRNAIPFPALAALCATVAAAAQGMNPQDEDVRGDIVAVSGDSLRVRTRGGQEVMLSLAPTLRVVARQRDGMLITRRMIVGEGGRPADVRTGDGLRPRRDSNTQPSA